MRIAVLLTCYNRVQTTLDCLSRFFACNPPHHFCLDLWVVDDGSTDGTGDAIRSERKRWRQGGWKGKLHLLEGSGKLYWCGGMRLAWQRASEHMDYDGYLWLNDDVFFDVPQMETFFKMLPDTVDSILAGACQDPNTWKASYGFQANARSPVEPDKECFLTYRDGMNGNCVFVPRNVFKKVGNFLECYIHLGGDFDYGWRALRQHVQVTLAPFYVGSCSRHDTPPKFLQAGLPIRERWRLFRHPKERLSLRAYRCLNVARWGVLGNLAVLRWPVIFIRACCNCLPTLRS